MKKNAKPQRGPDPSTTPITEADPELTLTSHEVAKLLKANATSINKWADDGKIKSYRTPGGHRRFALGSVAAFVEAYQMPVPRIQVKQA